MTTIKDLTHEMTASFPVRRMDFNFEGVNKYFYDNQPAMSMFMAAMQSFFPDGEQFFIDSVRHYRHQITDVQLEKDIGAFIGQEAMHGKEHRVVNNELLQQGVRIELPMKVMESIWDIFQKYTSHRFQLATTASLEHFTAVMGTAMLRNEAFVEAFNDPRIHKLIRWHAIEECEHKAIAFDTYQQVGGNYLERTAVMAMATIGTVTAFFTATSYLLIREGQFTNLSSWQHFGKTLFGQKGLFRPALKEYLDWYHPKFHPLHHDTKQLELYWKKKLFIK